MKDGSKCQTRERVSGKKALLVVSFGTSYIRSREVSIDAIENRLSAHFHDYDLYRAFTSKMIINIYKKRDGVIYKNVSQQIEHIFNEGYEEVLVVPTHVIHGKEYEQIQGDLEPYGERFDSLDISRPLLSTVDDYRAVADAVMKEIPGIDSRTAIVLLGHGTHHHGNSAYPALDYIVKHDGYKHAYIGTVEGMPSFEDVAGEIQMGNYERVYLMPLMIVAGDHAHEDMAGNHEDSWKTRFQSMGLIVDYRLIGLGELASIQEIFIQHAEEAKA